MLSFLITSLRLFRAVFKGLRRDPVFRTILALWVVTLLGGAAFYTSVEGWSFADSIYFCVMTMSTIGYGDLAPTTTFSKMFTVLYALASVGVFAALVVKIVSLILKKKVPRERHRARGKGRSGSNRTGTAGRQRRSRNGRGDGRPADRRKGGEP
jgi:hypothetical protein